MPHHGATGKNEQDARSMSGKANLDLTKRETFALFTPVTMRFCDTDKLGHINNVSIASYIEAARCELFDRLLKSAAAPPNIDYVLARIAIDFRRELHYPGTVEVGSRFLRLGNRSIVSGYGAFFGENCFATAESTNVFYDLDTRTSTPPTPEMRRQIDAWIAT
jgi:acyl-CoA thioester hydrolase